MATTMTKQDREAFLADLHVGIVSIERQDRAPITVPVWYSYVPDGELRFITGENSVKAVALRAAGRLSLCAQMEAPPYGYVSIEGDVLGIDPVDVEGDLRPLAQRYLGQEGGDRYVAESGGTEAGKGSVVVRVRPRRWYSANYSQG